MTETIKIRFGTVLLGNKSLENLPHFYPKAYHSFTSKEVVSSSISCEGSAAVELKCFTASGGNFFALCGGRFVPGQKSFTCRVGYSDSWEGLTETVADWILAGVSSLARYEAGVLEIDHGRVHPVDCKRWAWERAGAILARVIQSDVSVLSNEELRKFVAELAASRP